MPTEGGFSLGNGYLFVQNDDGEYTKIGPVTADFVDIFNENDVVVYNVIDPSRELIFDITPNRNWKKLRKVLMGWTPKGPLRMRQITRAIKIMGKGG